jgi:hypothetical protein
MEEATEEWRKLHSVELHSSCSSTRGDQIKEQAVMNESMEI